MLDTLLKSLNINPLVLLLNGVLFLGLLMALNVLFWKPMMRHLEKRKHDITDAYKTVENTRIEMENLRTEYQGRLAEIEADARGRIQQTVREAQNQREKMIADARTQADAMMQEGNASIATEREQTMQAMQKRLSDVSADAIGKVVGGALEPTQRALIEEYISQKASRS